MPDTSPHRYAKPWIVQELSASYRVVDAAGVVLGEIPFSAGRGLRKREAWLMAQKMVEAGELLADSNPHMQNDAARDEGGRTTVLGAGDASSDR